jgi:predicted 3-demethylubiquinone-9 3-methyltransferase (glyoxalase superfamily)
MVKISTKISPCLWFDDQAEEAVKLYVSLFKNSRILGTSRYSEEGAMVSGRKVGSVMSVVFELNGQKFMALNGGPLFKFNEAVSFMVDCKDQDEVDYYWKALSKGGQENQCGWLKDKFGLSWQIIPSELGEMMQDEDEERSRRVMEAMLKMKKIDVNILKKAYNSK